MGGKSTRSRADSFMSQLLYHLVPTGEESAQHEAQIDSPVIQGHNLPSHYTDRAILASLNFRQEIILVVSDVICLTSQRMWKVRATKTRCDPTRVLKQTSTNFQTSLHANTNKSISFHFSASNNYITLSHYLTSKQLGILHLLRARKTQHSHSHVAAVLAFSLLHCVTRYYPTQHINP